MPSAHERNSLRIVRSLVLLVSLLLHARQATAYLGDEHSEIGDRARALYEAHANEEDWLGLLGLDVYYYPNLRNWLVEEDEGVNWLWHFWDHHGGDNNGLYLFDSAYTRASGFWGEFESLREGTVFYSYVNHSASDAYNALGRIGHLTADMGVPAHVLNDPHGIQDYYEKIYIPTGSRPTMQLGDVLITGNLHTLMLSVNDITDDWPSDDYDAHDGGPTRTSFFLYDASEEVIGTLPGFSCDSIADTGFRAAIGHSAGLLRMFYNVVCPHTGAFGIVNAAFKGSEPPILYMTFTSFHDIGCFNGRIYYSTAPVAPETWDLAAWTPFLNTTTTDAQGRFVFDLSLVGLQSFNHKLWLMGKVWDIRYTDSHPAFLGYIEVDSTPPIINTSITG